MASLGRGEIASSKDYNFEGSVSGYGDDDIRGDGKKRKFKPLSAVKKFFTKKKDKKDSVVTVKAKSTTALHSGYRTDEEEDDDDGGFKSHPKPLALAGSRSLSEDSVFSPEPRSAPIAAFPKAALSEESLPKSAFQSELLSKLSKRQSQFADDYHDDGLPRSPVPPVTTADVIMGGPLKKLPGLSGKISNNRDSDQSLISVDSSENEEEDLFRSKWKSSVSAKKFVSSSSDGASSSTSNYTMDTFDLNSIQKTELLVSRAAKDKISVKPQRKTARHSRLMKDTTSPPTSLPSLNEESPTRSKPESVKGSWIPGSPTAKSPDKPIFTEEKSLFSSATNNHAPTDIKPVPSVRAGSKPILPNIDTSLKGSNTGSPLTSPSSLSPPVIVAATTITAAAPSTKVTTPTSPSTKVAPQKVDNVTSPEDKSGSSSSICAATNIADSVASTNVPVKNIDNFSLSERGDKTSLAELSVTRLSKSQQELNENNANIDLKSRFSQFQVPALDSDKKGIINTTSDDLSLSAPDSDYNLLASAKEDFKARRQIRSRTLPAVIDEQTSPRIQRSSSHRVHNSGLQEPQAQPEQLQNETAIVSVTSTHSVTISTATSSSLDTKKPENVKISSADSAPTPAGQPSWMSMVRKRNAEQEILSQSEKTQTTEPATTLSGYSTSAPKSVFSSSGYVEKKRGSVETVSYKNRELLEQASKKIDNSEAKLQSVDVNAQNKRTNTDVSSTKREINETAEISHLGSVKASRHIFDSNSKSLREKDGTPPTSAPVAAERIKQFSSSLSGSSVSSSSSVKSASNISHDPENVTTTGAADNAKPAMSAGGITHIRGASVKTTFAKTTEAKSSFYTRSGSIKSSSSAVTTAESSVPLEPASTSSKSEAASAVKLDSPLTSPASALPPAPHVSMHVAAQPNSSLPSQSSSVTPSTFYVKPFTAYSSKPATNIASASRPANAATHPDIKLVTTSTTTTNQTSLASNTALSTAGIKSISSASSSSVKTFASPSVIASVPTPISFAPSNVSTSSSAPLTTSSTTTIASSVTPSSTLSSSSRASSVRPHSSFTTPTAFKPHVTHSSSSHPISTSSLYKSPSFKAVTSTEKMAPVEKAASVEKVTSIQKASSIEKVASTQKAASIEKVASTQKAASIEKVASTQKTSSVETVASDKLSSEVKKPVASARVPAWRNNLSSKEVKIEIIENSPSAAPPTSSQSSSDVLRKGSKSKPFEAPKKTDGLSPPPASVEAEKTRRSSKVLDMVKNFQNLQVPS